MNFSSWLVGEMKTRGMNNSDLARKSGLAPSTVSLVISEQRQPGVEFCQGVAKAFEIPEDIVFTKAGLFTPSEGAGEDITFKELLDLARSLSVEERAELLSYIRWQLWKRGNEGGS